MQHTKTNEQYAAYQRMCSYFNERLFGGALPEVILNFSRKARTYGFFSPERWKRGEETAHEVSLNPDFLQTRPPREVAATLVHELCHLWQEAFGKPSRAGYHNLEWAQKMESVGLMPSSTGTTSGKITGQKMSHYIIEGGAFDRAFAEMPPEYLLPWAGVTDPPKTKTARRTKYRCEGCGAQAWGKKGLRLICGDCEEDLGTVEPEEPARLAAEGRR